jgi:hypothetical protein
MMRCRGAGLLLEFPNVATPGGTKRQKRSKRIIAGFREPQPSSWRSYIALQGRKILARGANPWNVFAIYGVEP